MRFFILIVLLATTISAQNTRFIYRYHYVLDSTKPAEVKSELLALEVDASSSKFFSYEKYRADSLTNAEIIKQEASGNTDVLVPYNYSGDINYLIEKGGNPKKIFITDHIGSDDFRVEDSRKMQWQILPEKLKIGVFQTQKAQTTMYGRSWTAWFTTEVPVQDGPYKFHGLPGLIVKIEDLTSTHSFVLEAVQKMLAPTQKKEFFLPDPTAIIHTQYVKLFREHRNDPAKSLRQMINENPNFKIIRDGVEISAGQAIQERVQSAKELQAKNNNILELDLIQD